jgi:hypothetical protein
MKTTLDLDDVLLAEAKRRAAAEGMSLKAFVEEALRARMLPKPKSQVAFRLELPVVRGQSPPAVSTADRRVLYDYLEEP